MLENFGGRKFFLTLLGIVVISVVPIIYSVMKIDSATTQIVVGAIAAGIGAFGAANVLSDKYANQSKPEDKP
jgi:nitrate/nitrite transporter NarK